jgi:hypothetical protein
VRTWSAERALDGLLTGLGNIAGISASAILEILWPTPVDPAEQLAEREAEEEVAEPKFAPMSCCGGVLFHHHCPEANARRAADVGPTITGIKRHARDFGADFIGPVLNGREPALSDDELVAVRGLIQERYDHPERAAFLGPYSSSPPWGVNPGDESAPHSQAVASPATVGEPPDPAVAGHFNDEHLKDAIYFGLSTYSGPLRVVAHLIAMDVLHKFRVSNK